MYFEGSEKKLELSLKQGSKSLKSLPKSFWESLVKLCGSQIVSSVNSPLCDSYLLAEASLFVFPHKFLMIANGKARLVPAVREFLSQFKVDDIDSLFYEAKNASSPASITAQFNQDAEELARLVPGQAFRMGEEEGTPLYLFHMDKASSYLRNSEATLEVFMLELNPEAKKQFTKGKITARKWIAENPDFKNFFASFDILDHGFEPLGYSLNAIKGDRYFTFHVNPQAVGSFASFETNCFDQGVDELVQALKSLFMPENYQVVLFASGTPLPFNSFSPKAGNLKLDKVLSSGHTLQFYSVREKVKAELVQSIELPKYVEVKAAPVTAPAVAKNVEDSSWFYEKNEKYSIGSKIKETLLTTQSSIQKIEVHDTESWGKTLVCDGQIICTEKDEFIYHEMITHVPLFVHPDPARVLIIGGGDLGAASEVLKHTSVLECICVEADQKVVDAVKAHFEWPENVLTDPRFELIIGNAVDFVATTEKQFDVVIVDAAGPSGAGAGLYTEEFYNNVRRVLAAGGVVLSQAESPLCCPEEQKALKKTLSSVFSKVFLYNYSNASYLGGLWSFAFSSENFHPLDDFDREKAMKSQIDFKYYSPELHYAAFILPTFMKKNLREAPRVEVDQSSETLQTSSDATP